MALETAHDICADYYEHGVDVTMFQRSSTYVMTTKNGVRLLLEGLYSETSPPTDVADRLNASFPNRLMEFLAPRAVLKIAEADKYVPIRLVFQPLMFSKRTAGRLAKAWIQNQLRLQECGFLACCLGKSGWLLSGYDIFPTE